MCVFCACLIETLLINHHWIPHVNSCSARPFDPAGWQARPREGNHRSGGNSAGWGKKSIFLVQHLWPWQYYYIVIISIDPWNYCLLRIKLKSIFLIYLLLFNHDLSPKIPVESFLQALRHALLRAELRLKALRQRAVSAQRDVSASPQDGNGNVFTTGKEEPIQKDQRDGSSSKSGICCNMLRDFYVFNLYIYTHYFI